MQPHIVIPGTRRHDLISQPMKARRIEAQRKPFLIRASGMALAAWLATTLLSPAPARAEAVQYGYDSAQRLIRVTEGDGTTIDYTYDNLGNRLVRAVTRAGGPPNNSPVAVSVPGIPNGAVNVSTSPNLTWPAAADPNSGDTVVYFVYFGTVASPPLAYSGLATNWSPGHLKCYATYYWQVVARDNHNAQAASPVWSFTTSNEPPVVNFAATPASGAAPLVVQFRDSSTYDCGAMVSWQWDFDNNGTIDSTSQNPAFTYPSTPGDYSVKLTVRDEHGGVSTLVKTNFISVLGPNIVDLSPVGLNVESAASYRNLVVSYAVTNLGVAVINGKWQWIDRFYLSTNGVLDANATELATFPEYQTLLPGAAYTRTNLVVLPEVPLDNAYLLLKTDASNQLVELRETNNLRVLSLRGRLPDLSPAAFAYSGQPISGQPLDMTYTVTNRGALGLRDLSGGSVEWYDAVYISSNAVWDAEASIVSYSSGSRTLAAGTNYSVTNTLSLPDWPPGSYHLILRANEGALVVESNTANNTLTIPITVAAPDLAAAYITVPNGAPSDAEVRIIHGVTNRSGTPAEGIWMDTLYLSTNAVWDESATLLKESFGFGPVPGPGSYAVTNSVRLPGWPAGAYYVILKVNEGQYLSETSQANNTLAVPFVLQPPAGLPDLAPVWLRGPTTAHAGQGIDISYAVTNMGSLTATGFWIDVFWISTSPVWDDAAEYLDDNYRISPLAVGGTYSSTNTLNLPLLEEGNYFLIVQVNAYDRVYETTGTNNFRATPIVIQPSIGLPDLLPLSMDAPSAAATGQTVQVTYTVSNLSLLPVTGSWMDVLWLSTNSVWDDTATYLGLASITGPVPGMSNYVRTLSFKVPAVSAGNYYLIVQTDMIGQITEADENNNELAKSIVIQTQGSLPDLSPVLLSAPGTAAAGQIIQVIYAVTNRGAASAVGTWYDHLVLSTNTAWHMNDYLLAFVVRTQALAAASSYRVTNSVALPAWAPGTYYLVLNSDIAGSLGEVAETNNVLYAPISLTTAAIAPVLGGGEFLSDARFRLAVTGALGTNYTLQFSTNLAQWARLLDFTCIGSPTYVEDMEANNIGRRFYRIAPLTGSPPFRLSLGPGAGRATGAWAVKLDGSLGKNYRIDASTNLVDWVLVTNLPNTVVPLYFSDSQSTNYVRRFYRAVAP